jgi:hypothetical protein
MPEANGQPAGVIRIMLAEVSGLTAEFVRAAIEKQADMAIVAEVPAGAELGHVLASVATDVVVTALSSAEVPATYHGLVFQIPSIAVVAIGEDRRRVEVYNGTVIHEAALGQLVGVIRDLVANRQPRLAPLGAAPSDG